MRFIGEFSDFIETYGIIIRKYYIILDEKNNLRNELDEFGNNNKVFSKNWLTILDANLVFIILFNYFIG